VGVCVFILRTEFEESEMEFEEWIEQVMSQYVCQERLSKRRETKRDG